MENNYLENIRQDPKVRQRLIALKAMQKDEALRESVNVALRRDWEALAELLKHEDAKVRKNAALLLGEAGVQESVDALAKTYMSEKTLFVRPAYLTALGQLDYRKYIDVFEERQEALKQMEILESDRKHLNEERHLLVELLDMANGSGRHEFCKKELSRVILSVPRGMEDVVCDELKERFLGYEFKKMHGGILTKSRNPEAFFSVRTWRSMLFVFCANNGFEKDGEKIAQGIVKSDPLGYLNCRHTGRGIWRFRVAVYSKDDGEKKAELAKKTAFALEALCGGQMLNSTSDYEMEFVLMEGANERIFVYMRLHTFKDHRFDYRKNFTAASMNPVSAAQMIALCHPYFKENANVLDPFCGVGTLLIERKLWSDTRPQQHVRALYGLDIYKNAVDFGRENAAYKHCRVNFIQRDFFDFSHSYLFDEIITDTPENFGTKAAQIDFFVRFFKKAAGHLSPDGKIFMFTRSIEEAKAALKQAGGFKTLMCRPFSQKGKAWVLIVCSSRQGE